MSDSDDLDLDGGDAPDAGGGGAAKKRGGGLGGLLPSILKFVAIGLGALIFIVTVCIITVNILNKGGKSQTVIVDPNGPYVGKRPEYSYYDGVGTMTVRTRDFPVSSTVSVTMIIGYDLNDTNASAELTSRKYELRDFIRQYFSGKYASELVPEKEEELKADIREMLNTRFLDTAKARNIYFDKFDVMENY